MANESVVRRRGLTKLFMLVTGAAVLSSLLVAAAASYAPVVPSSFAGPMRFASIASTPEAPVPWEEISVTARIEGPVFPATVNLQYAAYFATVEAGTVAMRPVGGRTYEATIGGFPDGTEVWVVVATMDANGNPMISESFTVPVGTVPRSPGIRFTDVSHSPESPGFGEVVTVEAHVSSTAPIAEVDVAYMAFCPNRPPAGIDPPMTVVAPQVYRITLEPDPVCRFSPGTLVVYRVIARDIYGNTAVSEDGTIRFAQDGFTR